VENATSAWPARWCALNGGEYSACSAEVSATWLLAVTPGSGVAGRYTPPEMVIHTLTDSECLGVLSRAAVGRLACAHSGQPYIVPISLYFDGTAGLYSFSAVGQKIRWMRQNPQVCVEVDEVVDRFHWTTVVVTGSYEELTDTAAEKDALRRAFDSLQQHAQWWLPATAVVMNRPDHVGVVMFRVRIRAVSGRRTARTDR
jgi:nitroimidazol reductase NimA-like FMN-containing flavoprotein (pyridoxamine 5'-phosphate oxidase superfamily)